MTGAAHSTVPGPWRWLFHVLVLWSFAVAQPLYDKIAENLPFLLTHRLEGLDVVLFALIVLVPVPIVLWFVVIGAFRVAPMLGWLLRALAVLVLVTVALFPLIKGHWLPDSVALALAAGLALVPAIGYATRFWNGLLDLLTPAPLLFLGFFVLVSPARLLVFDVEADATAGKLDRLDTPVVLVLLDEMTTQSLLDQDGELDRDRLPGFARLADISTWYPRATTVVEATAMAVPVFLSGVLPANERRQPPVYQHFPENLFDQVSSDRRIWALENGSRLCRPGRCMAPGAALLAEVGDGAWRSILLDTAVIFGHMSLPDALRARYLPPLGTRWAGFVDDGAVPSEPESGEDTAAPREIRWDHRIAEYEAFLESLETLGPDTLHYLHLLLPHAPWTHLPDGRLYDVSRAESIHGMVPDHANDTEVKHMWHDDEWATVIGEQRYLMQLHYVDRLIDRLLDRLQASEHFDELLLVVAADHGAGFTPGTSRRALTEYNFAEILPVPLFVRFPGQDAGMADWRHAELLDVAPTVRHALGLETDGLDGLPLQQAPRDGFMPRLVNDAGEYFEFGEEPFQIQFNAILERMHERMTFAEDGFVKLRGRDSDYGRPLPELGAFGATSDQRRFIPDNPGLWQNHDPDGRFAPARLVGRLEGNLAEGAELVAAIDGRIAGFSRPFSYPEADGRVEFMLWPEVLVAGYNELAVYEVADRDGEVELLPLHIDRSLMRLEADGPGSWRLHDEAGETMRIGTGPPWGEVYLYAEAAEDIRRLRGWAGDPLSSRAAESVHVFVGSEAVGSAVTGESWPQLVDRFGIRSLENAGFSLAIPYRETFRDEVLRVIALDAEGRAARLNLSGSGRADWPFASDPDFDDVYIPGPMPEGLEPGQYQPGRWIHPGSDQPEDMAAATYSGAWHGVGDEIRWAGRRAGLCLAVGEENGPWLLQLEVVPFLHEPALASQRLKLTVDSVEVTGWVLDDRRMYDLEAEIPAARAGEDGRLCLEFFMPDAVVPERIGASDDVRVLSVAFRRIRLLRP